MKKLIRKPIRESKPHRIKIGRVSRSRILVISGEKDLEREANRLKEEHPSAFHARIDENLEWGRREMGAVPGSVSVQDAMLVLSDGLPPLSRRAPLGSVLAAVSEDAAYRMTAKGWADA